VNAINAYGEVECSSTDS